MIGIGVIGYGYWGPNLVRNFNEAPGARVLAVSDLRPERLAQVRLRYPNIRATSDVRELLADPAIDALVVATPVSTHFDLAMEGLHAGKHVLVEKPLAATSEQGERLVEEAERCRRVLMVDHTFVYTGAVRKIKELLNDDQRGPGQLYYYDAVRVNLGLFQHDVSVLWDLAVHDLSIMDYLLAERPCAVSAVGMAHLPGQPKDVAYLNCFFNSQLIAHFHVNWLAPVKIRRSLIGGDRRMIVYDDLDPSEPVRVYDRGVTLNNASENVYQLLVGYRTGDMWAPQVNRTEALQVEARHFLESIENGTRPLTDGRIGLRVVKILEAATLSLGQRGRPVDLVWDGE